jgi:hypothetical protein
MNTAAEQTAFIMGSIFGGAVLFLIICVWAWAQPPEPRDTERRP